MMLSSRRISAAPALLGESPVWDDTRRRLYWVDSVDCRIHALDVETGATQEWVMPSMVGSIGLAEGDNLVAGLADGIYLVDLVTGAAQPLFRPQPHDPMVRFNDGKTDRQGRFLCGTMGVQADARGVLYRIDGAGDARVLANGVRISNAVCFSPDGSTMYFADSLDRRIRAYSYSEGDEPLARPRCLIDTKPFASAPDGATVDSDGCLWVALVKIGKIARFTPEGELDRLIEAPTDMPSCVAFGGDGMATLFVTSIKNSGTGRAVSRHAAGGHVFAIEGLGVTGIPETPFRPVVAH